jgi:hypothetical protein
LEEGALGEEVALIVGRTYSAQISVREVSVESYITYA